MLPKELQRPTQVYGSRPYGVGILVAGYDVSLKPLIYDDRPMFSAQFQISQRINISYL